MAESSAINKSLSVLGQVVHALNQGAVRVFSSELPHHINIFHSLASPTETQNLLESYKTPLEDIPLVFLYVIWLLAPNSDKIP
jgi:hypothetical protein